MAWAPELLRSENAQVSSVQGPGSKKLSSRMHGIGGRHDLAGIANIVRYCRVWKS